MAKINESALRLPTFAAGEEVLLSDDQRWTFRTPRVVMTAVLGGLGTTLIPRWVFGDPEVDSRYDRMMTGLRTAQGDAADFYLNHVVAIASLQLQQNYRLSQYEARSLLLPQGGDTPDEMLRLMTRVTLAAVRRPQEMMAAAEARMPYHTAEDYRRHQTHRN